MPKRLEEWTLEDYQLLHKIVKFDPKSKRWKGIIEASEKFGVTRPTIRKALEIYPTPPPPKAKLVKPRYEERFEETEIYQKIKKRYWDVTTNRLTSHGDEIKAIALTCWLFKNHKDPVTFALEDFKECWDLPDFIDPKTKKIAFAKASALRILMSMAGYDPKQYPEFTTKGLKRKPAKKTWYLERDETLKVIYAINEPDTLTLFGMGILSGARWSALALVKVGDIAYELQALMIYEPKVEEIVEKYFPKVFMDFLRRYITDFSITGKLFQWTYSYYLARLHEAGVRSGLMKFVGYKEVKKGKQIIKVKDYEGKIISTHLMKHTFVTQAGLHGVSLDSIAEMTGTDAETLRKFYLGVGKKKMKVEILGAKMEYEPWWEFVEFLTEHFNKRYDQIKDAFTKVNGLKLKAEVKPKKEKITKKRVINWLAIENMVKKLRSMKERKEELTEGQKRALRVLPYWEQALALHKEGLTYPEIKRRLAKKEI